MSVLGQCVIINNQGKNISQNKHSNNKEMEIDQIVWKDLTNGKPGCFFYDCDRKYIYKISKSYIDKWIAKTDKFVTVRIGKIGLMNNQLKRSIRSIKEALNKLNPKIGQSFFSSIASFIPKIFGIIEKVKSIAGSDHLMPMILDVSSLLLQAMSPTYSNWTPSYLLGHLLRFYSLYVRGKTMVLGQSTSEAFTLAAVSMLLPAPLLEIVKRMNLFTGKKILDTPSSALDCLTGLVEFIVWCVQQIPFVPECVRDFFTTLSNFSSRSIILREMLDKITQYSKCKSIMLESEWRTSVRILDGKINDCEDLQLYFKSSPVSMSRYRDFKKLVKSLEAYEKCSRREPVAIIFEGPPGTRKSFIMSNLTDRMGKSVYTHVVKAMTDGKDFYDTYNNEEVFLMDDVGQQGISQWRTIINMVSTVKLPLDCAAVELKDTKFFNSELIMCTTNNFSNIGGLTKSDCIADIRALWRRCHVFNFDEVQIINGEMKGKIVYKRFCPYKNMYVSTFPFDSSIPTTMDVKNKHKVIAWMNVIVKRLNEYYDSNYTENQIGDADQIAIKHFEDQFMEDDFRESNIEGEGLFRSFFGGCLKVYFKMVVDFLKFIAVSGILILIPTISDYFNSTDVSLNTGPSGYSFNWVNFLCMMSAIFIVNLLTNELLHYFFNKVDDVLEDEDFRADVDVVSQWKKVSGQSLENPGTLADSISNRMVVAEILHTEKDKVVGQICQALISGHFIIGPQHAFLGKQKGILNAYKDWNHYECNSVVLNNIPYEVVYEDMAADLVIAKLPTYMLTPFKNCKDYFKVQNKTSISKKPIIVTPGGVFRATRNFDLEKKMLQYTTYRQHEVDEGNYIEYADFTSPGLSGSLVVDPIEGIIGMHVAGDKSFGNAIIYNLALRRKINSILSGDNLIADLETLDTQIDGFSGNKYQTDLYQNVPTKTSLVPSPLTGAFEQTKFPANLSVKGVKTVEVMAEKSFLKIPVIPERELKFAGTIFNIMIPNFTDITDIEIVKGNETLAPLNKKSVNGFGFEKDKNEYIDFENGCIRENMIREMNELEQRVLDKSFSMEDVLFYETLKDELRVEEKVDKPRSFRVCRLPIILWQKRIFGDLFQQILKTSDFNQVSLGSNPYTDWDKYYKEMTRMAIVFDIDIKTFDGKQAAQMQDLCNTIILAKYKGKHQEMAKFLLEMIVRSWLLVRNKLMTTTHSLPSGIWLTGLLNSFYNRGYSACSFSRECYQDGKEPTAAEFFSLLDRVCGDDKLCGAPAGLEKYFNALTLCEFFNSIGMTATTGKKKEITTPGQDISEVTFLKRTFQYHPELGRVMGPLDKETLVNSLQWYDSGKDMDVVMEGKLNSFQREMYLHADGDIYVESIKKACKRQNVPFPLLTKEYIKHLYLEEPDTAYRLYISDNNKNYHY